MPFLVSLKNKNEMASRPRLIVGLGNPGARYEGTRHNVGFEVIHRLAERARIPLKPDRARSIAGSGSFRARPFVVCMPQTYMNLSGESVLGWVRHLGITPADLLVVVDDLALPAGTLRIRPSGSHGGHNGLEHIAESLGTDLYPRLRIGIGSDFPRGRQAEYVLAPFSAEQRPLMDDLMPLAVEACLTFITDGVQIAMNRYNAVKSKPKKEEDPERKSTD